MLYVRTQAGDHDGHARASARVGPSVVPIVKNIQKTHVNLGIQSVTARRSLEFPNQYGDFSKPYGMLYARTQVGDHPRASPRVKPSPASTVKNVQQNPC